MRTVFNFLFILSVFCSFPANAVDYDDTYSKDEIGYDKFLSVQDDYKLVMKDNDIYVYDIAGLSRRRITHTAKLNKPMATFSKDRGYILYAEYSKEGENEGELKYYRVKFDQDDDSRQLISSDEYNALASGGK
ncbi:MAG: hypothetical protein M0R48_07935 [Candidatus Omnitrophica bacterium]|jgi:Tol biopolymer transport system component|nr:hypothetical protein [Candidatus Omnitrophota bacterium]